MRGTGQGLTSTPFFCGVMGWQHSLSSVTPGPGHLWPGNRRQQGPQSTGGLTLPWTGPCGVTLLSTWPEINLMQDQDQLIWWIASHSPCNPVLVQAAQSTGVALGLCPLHLAQDTALLGFPKLLPATMFQCSVW